MRTELVEKESRESAVLVMIGECGTAWSLAVFLKQSRCPAEPPQVS